MHYCEVCGQPVTHCLPSPFLPCSYWRCNECANAKRIAYWELLCVLCGQETAKDFDDRVRELDARLGDKYAETRLTNTINYFNVSKEKAWSERYRWEAEAKISDSKCGESCTF